MSIKLLSLFHAFGESDSKILGSVEIINSQLIGTGACLPDFVLTNAMLEHMVDTNDEWIVQRTGVRERRIAKNMHTWELALGAAQDALADAKIDAGELDLILVSSCTPDTNTPNTAAPLPVISAVTAPWARSRALIASLSFAPLHSSSAFPAAAHTASKSPVRIAFSCASQSGWMLLPSRS